MHHCSACGRRSDVHESRHWQCTACKHVDWVNPVPAVGVAIIRGEQVLLAKRAREPKKGQWDLVGGFIEPGETAQAAIAREVAEETGLTMTAAELVDVLPGDYGGRASINLLYIGQAVGEPVPADDVAALEWFPLEALPSDLAWPHEMTMLDRLAATAAAAKAMALDPSEGP